MMPKLTRWWPHAIFVLIAFGAPLILSGNRYFAFIAGITLISVLWSTGMNLLYGYTGLMPMMFGGIAGISAYATIGLVSVGWSFWLAMLVGSIGASLIGVILGLPSLRLRGFYFTLCSLVIQTVITLGFVYFVNLTNGDTGISQIPLPRLPGGEPLSGLAYDLVLAALAVIGVLLLTLIAHSPLGRRLVAIREDDGLAETLGINVTRQKLFAFFIGSMFASIGGALYAPYVGFISPRSFDVLVSLNVWLMWSRSAGVATIILGPVIGAALPMARSRSCCRITPPSRTWFTGLLIIGDGAYRAASRRHCRRSQARMPHAGRSLR